MKVPEGLTSEGLKKAVGEFVEKNFRMQDGLLVCRSCGTDLDLEIGTAAVCFDRHRKDEGEPCGGGGETENFAIPFCPKCEDKPTDTVTCIHTLPPLAANQPTT